MTKLSAVRVENLVGGQMYFLVDYTLKATCSKPFIVCGVRRKDSHGHTWTWKILIKKADGSRAWVPDAYWFQFFKFTPFAYRNKRIELGQAPL
ncbi:MAG: hypothetical protein A2675_03545 [Candidatus Yonathbacteria bacterium RIFCSPHIGHO2_01_FULL_51_10]|uniref:Uncharacterized protein n=1 Tax=Candidatus Yonathbacteria bacterium RIFCSPHIGHO2_01_FULL_51_10 TaxID=1802723 RepID=A0A1G2S8V4_9BACT|nr:MAG: hypothetical protein A2675_03545 [Candidatus Yonathbacteria bacterium RIFCSPHIGHO2_01_FULL_51_10]